jgi:pyridoxine 4-dehydrogenase
VHRKLAERGVPLALAQVQLSLLSWGPLQQELVATAKELGVTVIAYSPLGLGMLTGRYSTDGGGQLPAGPRGVLFRSILPSCRRLQETLKEIADARAASQSQVSDGASVLLSYTLASRRRVCFCV